MLLLDDLVRGMDDDLRAGESGAGFVLILAMTRQIGLVMKSLGADLALKLTAGPRMNPDAMTLQVKAVLKGRTESEEE